MMELFQFTAVVLVLASFIIVTLLVVAVTRLGNIAFTLREQERFWQRGSGSRSREAYSGQDVVLDEESERVPRKRKPPASPIQGFE